MIDIEKIKQQSGICTTYEEWYEKDGKRLERYIENRLSSSFSARFLCDTHITHPLDNGAIPYRDNNFIPRFCRENGLSYEIGYNSYGVRYYKMYLHQKV